MQENLFCSRIVAGTMNWGSWGSQFSITEMADLIHHCLVLGISTFDHADIYGGYTTEANFGKALKESKIPRESIQLISKCGIQMDAEARPNKVKHYNYSREYILASVERSLKQLDTDYLDMLLLHRPSPLINPEEIGEAVLKLQKDGKLKTFGVSNFTPSQLALLETGIPVAGNQVEFSLTETTVMYDGTLDDCIANDRLAMSWSPLGSYFSTNNKVSARIKTVLEPMLNKYDASADQLLLAWIMKHPAKVHPVVGTTKESRLQASVNALDIEMDLEDWFLLLEAASGHEVP